MMPICLLAFASTLLMKNLSPTTSWRRSWTVTSQVEPLLKLTSTNVNLGSYLVINFLTNHLIKVDLKFDEVCDFMNRFWQIKRRWERKSGTSSACVTASTQLGLELTGLLRLGTGKPLGKIGRSIAQRLVVWLGWRRRWCSTEGEPLRERRATGSCMSIALKANLLTTTSLGAPRFSLSLSCSLVLSPLCWEWDYLFHFLAQMSV